MKRPTALQAVARARHWHLATLAQRQQALGTEQAAAQQQLHSVQQALEAAVARQQQLLAGAQFSAADLGTHRLSVATIAGDLSVAQQTNQALAAQAEALATEVNIQRREQALLDRLLEQRDAADRQAARTQAAREADALVAARERR